MNFKSLGRYILLIKNKPFEAMLPEVDGIVNYAVDNDLEIKERWYTVNGKKIPEVNILWFIENITPETVSKLDIKEQILILKDYYLGVKTVTGITKDHGTDMEDAKNDYDDAVNNILSDEPDFNSSRMASLQLAEKIIKLKLHSEGKDFEEGQRFTGLAEKLDKRNIDGLEEIIGEIEYSSEEGINYTPVTCEEAVNILKNSLRLYLKLFHPSKKPGIKIRGSSPS